MPLYEYQCVNCKRRTEKIENVSGPYLKKCPHCGGKVERTFTAPAIQFKGSGWYVNDYAAKKSTGSDTSPAKSDSSESKESVAKDSATKDSAAKESGGKESKEKKPAKKKE